MDEYLTIKEVSKKYKISISSLYKLSKLDPSFPAVNIGLKKKIVVNKSNFIQWINHKNFKEELIRLPSNTIIFRRRIYETTKHQR